MRTPSSGSGLKTITVIVAVIFGLVLLIGEFGLQYWVVLGTTLLQVYSSSLLRFYCKSYKVRR